VVKQEGSPMSNVHLSRIFAVAGLLMLIPALHASSGLSLQEGLVVSPESVRRHTMELADDKYEGRGAGYAGEQRAADYIAAEFTRIGLVAVGEARSYFQPFSFHPSHPLKPWETFTSRNVIGRIDGADAVLKNEIVVVGAHYDGQGRTGQADPARVPASNLAGDDEIWNSANDNAASVAALLEIARAIRQSGVAPKRSVLFVAFGAEEHGMAGSMHYIAHPVAPLSDHVAMINLEKLGRDPDKPFSVVGHSTSAAWTEIVRAAQQQTTAPVVPTNPFAVPESDHYPFAAARVPAIMLIVSGAPDAHQPSDAADRIDYTRVAQGARLALQMVLDAATRPQRPSYAPSAIPDMGLIGFLGTAAEADARGIAPPYGGLKVTAVIAGLPAARAGLQPGDFITEIASYQFRRDDQVPALMAKQREILEGKHGFTLPVKVVRGTTRLDLVMNLR
jgi:hypothetical protein